MRILLRTYAGGRSTAVDQAWAQAGRGLVGDRYHAGVGTFSGGVPNGRALTLIEAEALADLEADTGIALSPEDAGRNLLTRDVDLNALVGRRFRIGDVECRGDRLCDPCLDLERRTQPGVMRGLLERGGLRADILTDGEIAVGAQIEILDG